MLAQSMHFSPTIETLQLEHVLQTTTAGKKAVSVRLPVQHVTGHVPTTTLDLSSAGELSRTSCAALGAMLGANKALTTLRLSNTRLGDEAGSLLEHLGDSCRLPDGKLSTLDLSSIGLTDRGARKLFEALMSGGYSALTALALADNEIKDVKTNGLIDVLRAEDCTIRTLDVSRNAGLSGSILMRAIKLNHSLTSLNVCGTETDDDGMRALGELLLAPDCPCPVKLLACDHFEVLESTTSLDFSGKPLPSAAMTLLFGILKLNESVATLNLSGAGLDAAAKSLEVAISTNAR